MNTNQFQQLKVANPCPFVPKESNRNCDGFHCKGCNKTIIDFRGMTEEEILENIDENTCGIFNSDQLPSQKSIEWSKKPLFYGMMLMSFLGFSVRPVYGQTQPQPVKQAEEPVTNTNGEEIKITKSDVKKLNTTPKAYIPRNADADRKKKVVFKTIGCPSF